MGPCELTRIFPVFSSRWTVTMKMYELRVKIRFGRSSWIAAALVDPMNTRLMLVPPEFATRSVSGLFETNKPHGNEPTATTEFAKPRLDALCCQTFRKLNCVL